MSINRNGPNKLLHQLPLHGVAFYLLIICLATTGCIPAIQSKKTPLPVASESQTKIAVSEIENVKKDVHTPTRESIQIVDDQATAKAAQPHTLIATEDISSEQSVLVD